MICSNLCVPAFESERNLIPSACWAVFHALHTNLLLVYARPPFVAAEWTLSDVIRVFLCLDERSVGFRRGARREFALVEGRFSAMPWFFFPEFVVAEWTQWLPWASIQQRHRFLYGVTNCLINSFARTLRLSVPSLT